MHFFSCVGLSYMCMYVCVHTHMHNWYFKIAHTHLISRNVLFREMNPVHFTV